MRYLVAGMGVTGQAVARFLNQRNLPFDTYDDRKANVAELGSTHGTRHFRHITNLPFAEYGEIIVSPGLGVQHPLILAAHAAGRSIISEIGFAFRHLKGRVVAVTGTNGKSTTVSLIHHLLSACKVPSALCGNIGLPLIACVDEGDEETVFVVEVSSFQLEHPGAFRPDIAMLLNISPDHLDRHGSFTAYKDAKLRLFANQGETDLALADASWLAQVPGDGEKMAVPGELIRMDGGAFCVGTAFRVPLERLKLLGLHNRTNALFAMAALARLGVAADLVAEALPHFTGLEHRLETVGELAGRIWINDTKATNVHAAGAVIDAMERDYVLILGGYDKGEDFGALTFDREPVATVAYGDTAARIQAALPHLHIEIVPEFAAACRRAHQLAQPGQIVLLAPACASFDQFDNYTLRGHAFKALFREMGGPA